VRAGALACAIRGHGWSQPNDFTESYPVFECKRCGRRQAFAQGTRAAGFDARLEAQTGADKAVGPFARRR
jgi:hypothetical protein